MTCNGFGFNRVSGVIYYIYNRNPNRGLVRVCIYTFRVKNRQIDILYSSQSHASCPDESAKDSSACMCEHTHTHAQKVHGYRTKCCPPKTSVARAELS